MLHSAISGNGQNRSLLGGGDTEQVCAALEGGSCRQVQLPWRLLEFLQLQQRLLEGGCRDVELAGGGISLRVCPLYGYILRLMPAQESIRDLQESKMESKMERK